MQGCDVSASSETWNVALDLLNEHIELNHEVTLESPYSWKSLSFKYYTWNFVNGHSLRGIALFGKSEMTSGCVGCLLVFLLVKQQVNSN